MGFAALAPAELGRSAISGWASGLLAAASALLLFAFGVNTTWLIAGGAIVGLLLALTGAR